MSIHTGISLSRAMAAQYSTVQALAQAVATAITMKRGDALALALEQDLGNTALLAQLASGRANLKMLCQNALDRQYDEMLHDHLQSLLAASRGEHVQAYEHQERACGCFHVVFEKDTSWSLPALQTLDLALRRAAMRADEQLKEQGKKPEKLAEAAGLLQKSFRIVVTDRAPIESSKKWGALHVINNLFKIYFQLNNLRLCQNLIRAVEGPGFPKGLDGQVISGRNFPMAQLVTYHYFVGRLSLLNSQFARAERQLTFSFDRCPAASFKNKRLILRYLVPVRLVRPWRSTRHTCRTHLDERIHARALHPWHTGSWAHAAHGAHVRRCSGPSPCARARHTHTHTHAHMHSPGLGTSSRPARRHAAVRRCTLTTWSMLFAWPGAATHAEPLPRRDSLSRTPPTC